MGVSTDAILAFGFDLRNESVFSEIDFDKWYDENVYNKGLSYDVLIHCSYEFPMYFLAAASTVITARRGFPADVEMPEVAKETIEAMKEFCNEYDIEWQEPNWKVFSLWG